MLTVYKWLLKVKVSRVCTDHQKGIVTERVTRECGEVCVMLEDGAAVWLPAALTFLSSEIPACSHRVQTLPKTPEGHIHPTAQRLQRDSIWKWHTGGDSHEFISMRLEVNLHAQWGNLLILWTGLWYISEVRVEWQSYLCMLLIKTKQKNPTEHPSSAIYYTLWVDKSVAWAIRTSRLDVRLRFCFFALHCNVFFICMHLYCADSYAGMKKCCWIWAIETAAQRCHP